MLFLQNLDKQLKLQRFITVFMKMYETKKLQAFLIPQ